MISIMQSLDSLKKSESSSDRRQFYTKLFCGKQPDNVICTFFSQNSGWVVPLMADALESIANNDGHQFYFDVLERIFLKLEVLPCEEDVKLMKDYIVTLTNKAEEIFALNDSTTSELVVKLLPFVIKSVRKKFNDVHVVNNVCIIFKHGFKSNHKNVAALTYCAWRTLIAAFASEPSWSNPQLGSVKRKTPMSRHLELITKPLFYPKVICFEAISDAVFETWWNLAKSVGERLPFLFEEILVPYLLFCLGAKVQSISSDLTDGKVIFSLSHRISDSEALVTFCISEDCLCKTNFKMLPKLGLKALALLENILRDDGEFKCAFTNSFSIARYGIFVADCLRKLAYNTTAYGMIERSTISNALPKLWCSILKKLDSLDSSLLSSRLKFFNCQFENFCLNDSTNVELSKGCLRTISSEFSNENLKKISEPIVQGIEAKLRSKFDLTAKNPLTTQEVNVVKPGESSEAQMLKKSFIMNGLEDSEDSDVDRIENIASSNREISATQSNNGNNLTEGNGSILENPELDKSGRKQLPRRNRRAPVIFGTALPKSSTKKAKRDKGTTVRAAKTIANKKLSKNVSLANMSSESVEIIDLDLTTKYMGETSGILAKISVQADALLIEKSSAEKNEAISNESFVANKENNPIIVEAPKRGYEVAKEFQAPLCSLAVDIINKKSSQRRGPPLNIDVQNDEQESVAVNAAVCGNLKSTNIVEKDLDANLLQSQLTIVDVNEGDKTKSLLFQTSKIAEPVSATKNVSAVLLPKKGSESSTSKIPMLKRIVRRADALQSATTASNFSVVALETRGIAELPSKSTTSAESGCVNNMVSSTAIREEDCVSKLVEKTAELSDAAKTDVVINTENDSAVLLDNAKNNTAINNNVSAILSSASVTTEVDGALNNDLAAVGGSAAPSATSSANVKNTSSNQLSSFAMMPETSSAMPVVPSTPIQLSGIATFEISTPPASILRKPDSPATVRLSSRRVHFDVEAGDVDDNIQVTSTTPKMNRGGWTNSYGSTSPRKRRSLLTKYSPMHFSSAGNTEYPLIPLASLERSLIASTSAQASGTDSPSKGYPSNSSAVLEGSKSFSSFIGEPPVKRLNISSNSTERFFNEMEVDDGSSTLTGAGDQSAREDEDTSMMVSENDWIMPDCANVDEPISLKMCQMLAPATGADRLHEQLKAKGISTVGMFARLTEKEISQLQIKAQPTKLNKAKTTLLLLCFSSTSTPKKLGAMNRSIVSNTTANSSICSVEANFSFFDMDRAASTEKVISDSVIHATNTFTFDVNNNHGMGHGPNNKMSELSSSVPKSTTLDGMPETANLLPGNPSDFDNFVLETVATDESVQPLSPKNLDAVNEAESITTLVNSNDNPGSELTETGEGSSSMAVFRRKYQELVGILSDLKPDELTPEFDVMAFSMIKKLSILSEKRQT